MVEVSENEETDLIQKKIMSKFLDLGCFVGHISYRRDVNVTVNLNVVGSFIVEGKVKCR